MILARAILAGALATLGVRAVARATGRVAQPNPIVPQHRKPVAHLGGLGIAAGAGAALLVGGGIDPQSRRLMAPALGFLLIGLADDLRPFRAVHKLGLQALVAALTVAPPLHAVPEAWGLVARAAALAWIVLMVNAVNVTDVCDGLVAGLAAIAFLFLGAWTPELRTACWALAGGCIGFLFLNRPSASIFMGDTGSHLIGFALAAETLLALGRAGPLAGAVSTLAATAVFLFETGFLIVVRSRKGLAFWKGSPDHFALRMQHAGISKWLTVGAAWGAAAGLGLGASVARAVDAMALPFLAGLALGALLFARWLLRHEVRAGARPGGATAAIVRES